MRMYLLLFVWTTILQTYTATGARITCGKRVIHAKHQYGTFTSPGFPFNYPNNMDCEWVIQAPEGHQVEIIFLQISTELCCDTIELRDGNSSSAGLLITYGGEVTESMYASSFGSLYLKFTSDDSYVDYGFIAEYRLATTRSINCTMESEATNDVQVISSPGYPHLYENNLLCSWTLVAPEDKSVEINFTEFSTESCCDFVLVRHGRSMNSPIHNYGGHYDEPIVQVSTGNVIQVTFRSDSSVLRKGFRFEYKAVDRILEPIQETKDQDESIACGKQFYQPNLRIIGGSTAVRGTWPWMVSIEEMISGEYSLVCGGTLICENWVLTAAHCFSSLKKGRVETTGQALQRYRLHIGRHFKEYNSHDFRKGMLANIKPLRVIIHEGFNTTTPVNDIALIQLKSAVRLNRIIRPACIHNVTDDYHPLVNSGESCVSAGWGAESSLDNPPKPTHVQVLKQVELKPRTHSLCQSLFKDFDITKMHCVGGSMNNDTCGGDSGGPLMCKRGDRWYVDGIVSFGLKCGVQDQPAVYTRVPRYSEWIHRWTGKQCGSPDVTYT